MNVIIAREHKSNKSKPVVRIGNDRVRMSTVAMMRNAQAGLEIHFRPAHAQDHDPVNAVNRRVYDALGFVYTCGQAYVEHFQAMRAGRAPMPVEPPRASELAAAE